MAKKRTPLVRAKRKVTRQLLHDQGTHMHVCLHQLHRLVNDEEGRFGLTRKEREFIKKRRMIIEREVGLLGKLANLMLGQENG